MPRKHLPPRKARAAMLALKLEKARYEIRALRRAEREAEAALALRNSTPEWVELDGQLKQLQLEAEMDAMADAIDTRRPKIPILNFDLMPGFSPPKSHMPKNYDSAPPAPAVHPDVLIQAELTAAEARRSANENASAPPGGKVWKYDSTLEGRRPEDDYRNYE